MFRRGCIKDAGAAACDCTSCQRDQVVAQAVEERSRYVRALDEERRGLVLKHERALALGEAYERIPDPNGPLVSTIKGEHTGLELARQLSARIDDVDAELARLGA